VLTVHDERTEMLPGTITFKDESVSATDIQPVVFRGLAAAAAVFAELGLALIVTSLNDGHHRDGSLHYAGRAADVRSKHVPAGNREQVYHDLAAALGPAWDVVFEDRGGPNEHYHLEYDPK
jgi:hypothetical protein